MSATSSLTAENTSGPDLPTVVGSYACAGFAAFIQCSDDETYWLVTHVEGGKVQTVYRFEFDTHARIYFFDLVEKFIYMTSRTMMMGGPFLPAKAFEVMAPGAAEVTPELAHIRFTSNPAGGCASAC